MPSGILSRLASSQVLIADGATGTVPRVRPGAYLVAARCAYSPARIAAIAVAIHEE